MKVKELKEILNKYDNEAEIMLEVKNDKIFFLTKIKDFGKTIIFSK